MRQNTELAVISSPDTCPNARRLISPCLMVEVVLSLALVACGGGGDDGNTIASAGNTTGGSTSTGGTSTGGNASTGGGSTSAGDTSTGGNTSTGGGSTSTGDTSTGGNASTGGGNTSTGDTSTGGGASTGGTSTSGGGASGSQTTYAVTPSTSGSGGAISPASTVLVNSGATTSFTLAPDSGYTISSVNGSCGGSLSGNTYTTRAITANCNVVATFAAGSSNSNYVVSTIAGQPGRQGATDGPATVATFYNPTGVAIGPNGSLYVADSWNNKIRKVAADGTVSTVAGTGASDQYTPPQNRSYCTHNKTLDFFVPQSAACANAVIRNPRAVVVGKDGSLYITTAYAVSKITSPGTAMCTVSVVAGNTCYPNGFAPNDGQIDGVGVTATFADPAGLTLDAVGNLYVVDTGDAGVGYKVIRKVAPDGTVTTIAGRPHYFGSTDGMGASATFNGPWAIVNDQAGNLYVSDTWNRKIRKILPNGMVSTFAGTGVKGSTDGPVASATFTNPMGLAIDASGNIYVGDDYRLRKITPDGQVTTLAGNGVSSWRDGPAAQAEFYDGLPGVAVGADGTIYLADQYNQAIRKVASIP